MSSGNVTDTSERGLEDLIVAALTATAQRAEGIAAVQGLYGRGGWILGDWRDYEREYAVDLRQLTDFLQASQPDVAEAAQLAEDGPTRRKFLARLQGEITRHGVVDVLRKGIQHGAHHVTAFHASPTPGNRKAEDAFALNRFSVTRQLRYSREATQLALDLALFINGLPVATFELKNSLTKQTVADAVEQYRNDRDPRELLFQFGRCLVHFAVDDAEVRFCTELKGKASWFLPFNKGWNDGAGNPPNPEGLKTDYLWTQVLTRAGLTGIIENYAQIVEEKNPKTGRIKRSQIFPRYHQRDVVRELLADAQARGAGQRYLIQHSAGSGKSNSIAWLAHQLVGLQGEAGDQPVFDSVIVVTDRRILDKQIRDTIKQFAQVKATVGHAEHSGDLRRFIAAGRKIIITTVQKFPHVLDEIGSEHAGRRFAILIDEAHSGQGGRTALAMNRALAGNDDDEDESTEDRINALMAARKLLPNASYFAFTATPKNKTLELFGVPLPQADGTVKHRPFHSYTMKQATEERFILDVLKHYTPINSYYKLIKKIEDDPKFDASQAKKKLRRYVESHDHAIRLKAEIMVDHFHQDVLARQKVGGQARAMVVTSGIERAIQYYHAISEYLIERKSPIEAIVAFSGEHEYGGKKVTEASLNGFASSLIASRIAEDPYRLLKTRALLGPIYLTGNRVTLLSLLKQAEREEESSNIAHWLPSIVPFWSANSSELVDFVPRLQRALDPEDGGRLVACFCGEASSRGWLKRKFHTRLPHAVLFSGNVTLDRVELLVVPNALVVAQYHLQPSPASAVTFPIGFVSVEEDRIEKVTEVLRDRLQPSVASSVIWSADSQDIHSLVDFSGLGFQAGEQGHPDKESSIRAKAVLQGGKIVWAGGTAS